VLSGIGFAGWVGHWRFVSRAILVLLLTLGLLFASGVFVGSLSQPPVLYTEFPPVLTGVLISIAVGVAAALANTDDVGRRELIGLAATSQIAIVPAWLGLCAMLGLPATEQPSAISTRLFSLGVNILCVVIASLVTYIALRAPHPSLRILNDDK
jgi:hypothetical protein